MPHEGALNVFKAGFDKAWQRAQEYVQAIRLPGQCAVCEARDTCKACAAMVYSCQTDDLSYGYIMDDVRSSTSEQEIKALGAGMKTEQFWYDLNDNRYQEYSSYTEQIFPVVDLWFSDAWNQKIQILEF